MALDPIRAALLRPVARVGHCGYTASDRCSRTSLHGARRRPGLQGCSITTPALPSRAACITIKSLPDPEFAPFFLRNATFIAFGRCLTVGPAFQRG